jgi:hypothetical protein
VFGIERGLQRSIMRKLKADCPAIAPVLHVPPMPANVRTVPDSANDPVRASLLSEAGLFADWIAEHAGAGEGPALCRWLRTSPRRETVAALRAGKSDGGLSEWLLARAKPGEIPFLMSWIEELRPADVVAALRQHDKRAA